MTQDRMTQEQEDRNRQTGGQDDTGTGRQENSQTGSLSSSEQRQQGAYRGYLQQDRYRQEEIRTGNGVTVNRKRYFRSHGEQEEIFSGVTCSPVPCYLSGSLLSSSLLFFQVFFENQKTR